MKLYHMSGAGNTFLVGSIENDQNHNGTQPFAAPLVREMINSNPRPDGSRIEGMLVLRSHSDAHFTADYYNPDGSYGMMCGNGSRCIVRYAVDNGVVPVSEVVTFLLNQAPYTAHVHEDGTISVNFDPPVVETPYPVGTLEGIDEPVWYLDVNSDHAVITGSRSADRPIVQLLRHHRAFPHGVNVNMATAVDRSTIQLATFERGVEAITGACGTGAIASAIALWRTGATDDHATIIPPSGRPLSVQIHHSGATISGITLRGDAEYDIFETRSDRL